ncbi:hypothetical protein BN12_10075 [Nostocoides japonicum T1-X7]|uniref:Uncharacterized protein n=1 Tax=Nostocoides japonicum T1-X7 TaxID=1194083 RepID=A0A077LSL2_9MICO|nr:hypothetical protein BN12_10075 [Tetrasphaera japonica T1-X7]
MSLHDTLREVSRSQGPSDFAVGGSAHAPVEVCRSVREISAPRVDTKFAERHRSTLAGFLGVPSSTGGFLAGLGLRTKPESVRVRIDPWVGRSAGLPSALVSLSCGRASCARSTWPRDSPA